MLRFYLGINRCVEDWVTRTLACEVRAGFDHGRDVCDFQQFRMRGILGPYREAAIVVLERQLRVV
jgi:hypothetical protein